MNEEKLIQELNDLPCEIQAKDQWEQIKQAIEGESMATVIEPPKKRRWQYPVSIAASVFAVALLAVFIPKQADLPELNVAQQKTLHSLQQANSQYYSVLGNMMQQQDLVMPNGLDITLKDIRKAQKLFRTELAANPDDSELYKKLIKSYQTERSLLKKLMA